jgi:hypothetical protein
MSRNWQLPLNLPSFSGKIFRDLDVLQWLGDAGGGLDDGGLAA